MATVFHDGELVIQTESGVNQRVHKMGNAFIRNRIIDQHKEFYESLPYTFIALQDDKGRPWVSLSQGAPGFIASPDDKTLNISEKIIGLNELSLQTDQGKPIGMVGLDLSTRRRNRLNGNIKHYEEHGELSIAVTHSFGNCPKYVQQRNYTPSSNNELNLSPYNSEAERFTELNQDDINLIKQADTLFIASAKEKGGDLDANHRGGKPGFVHVDNQTQLWFNDYPGNNFFQTFGNIHKYPTIGLLFIDFQSGDLLLMSGQASLEKMGKVSEDDRFLPRRLKFTLELGVRLKQAVTGSWSFVEMSPFLADK